jgi:hypothetical protein
MPKERGGSKLMGEIVEEKKRSLIDDEIGSKEIELFVWLDPLNKDRFFDSQDMACLRILVSNLFFTIRTIKEKKLNNVLV